MNRNYRNREWLEREYVQNQRSYSDIARECGVDLSTIEKWVHHFGITPRNQQDTAWYTVNGITPEKLTTLYHEDKMSIMQIATKFGVSYVAVYRVFVRWGISRRKDGSRAGEHNHNWNGGKTINLCNGYAGRKVPGHPLANKAGYVMEHVLVMEEVLGRALQPGETVHHKNENKQDNRPENLYLFPTMSEHSRYHQKKRRANQAT